MTNPGTSRAIKLHAETEIAVLQVQVTNINEKIDDLKSDIKSLRDDMTKSMTDTHTMIVTLNESNSKQHGELSKKVSALEKWRWMMMGAGILAGALGWPVLAKVLGM
jgi:hypothetical protein